MMSLIKDIHNGAKTILAHFHYICKGLVPVEIDWTQDQLPKVVAKMAELSVEDKRFLASISQAVKQKSRLHPPLMAQHRLT